jgi:hypothetical protein
MSGAISGSGVPAIPGYRFAHPGYATRYRLALKNSRNIAAESLSPTAEYTSGAW